MAGAVVAVQCVSSCVTCNIVIYAASRHEVTTVASMQQLGGKVVRRIELSTGLREIIYNTTPC